MPKYWTIWLTVMFTTFLVPEAVALIRRRSQDTLSWWVWDHFQVVAHQPIRQWSASHVLFAGAFTTLTLWLLGHFLLRIWT